MSYDTLMFLSAMLFIALFLFLLAVNTIIVFALFKKKEYAFFQPKISVIIPAYNEEKNIAQCLSAVFASNYPADKYEVIVVDDGSTDSTAAIIKKFSAVRVVWGAHKGKSEAINEGIKKSKFEFVLTIDADTLLDKECMKNMVMPFSEQDVGAVAAVPRIANKKTVLGMFQNIEFAYNNLVRIAFSRLFDNTVWFHGACACYRKSSLQNAGGLSIDTLTEDVDLSLQMYKQGTRTVTNDSAYAYTTLPSSIIGMIKQRMRWNTGAFQCIHKHKQLFNRTSSFAILFIFINQWWWAMFSVLSLPAFVIQIIYWLPLNAPFFDVFMYFFRWFTLSGSVYVLYHMPEWGFSIYNFFGVMSGVMSTIFLIIAVKLLDELWFFGNAIALFFYFPYTILLNISIVLSILKYKFYKPSFFIR